MSSHQSSFQRWYHKDKLKSRLSTRTRVKKWRDRHKSAIKDHRLMTKLLQREICLDLLGRECRCCGEDNDMFLTIDHINNDGNKDRAKYHTASNIRRRIATGVVGTGEYQTLCFNCNCGRSRNGGTCPHKIPGAMVSPKGA